MIYPDNFEAKIGFDKIRQMLKEECRSSLGREHVAQMSFLGHFETLSQKLTATAEYIAIIRDEQFPFDFIKNIVPSLNRLKIEGTWMESADFVHLKRNLETAATLKQFFRNNRLELYPTLAEIVSVAGAFQDIIKTIDRVFEPNGEMRDNASPQLLAIRREMRQASAFIIRKMDSIMKKAIADGHAEADASPSVRDGRLVIPLVAGNKRKVRGIVQDESSTGKTVYVEPEEIVEANNKVRELGFLEQREIARILLELSNLVRPEIPEIMETLQLLGLLDFIRAKAMLSISLNAVVPTLVPNSVIGWFDAVHPLLFLTLKSEGKSVVPLTVSIDSEQRIVLISGPNAGGKSVCLKTVGIVQYMLQCGLPVPMAAKSTVGVFNNLFIDIGDEQSIENDLSTYSSHLNNMKHFLRFGDERSLILIDEFGVGTEPAIGGAIAEAILKMLNDRKMMGVITTHYTNLKLFAAETPGIENGAMLYDQHLMQPLFTLVQGKPGSSFAIEIARKIGLPDEVVQYASSRLGEDQMNMDKYLREILRDRRYWQEKRDNIRVQNKRNEELTEKLKVELSAINATKKEIINTAKAEAQILMKQANSTIENTIREIKNVQADKEKTRNIRETFESQKIEITTPIEEKLLPKTAKNEHKSKSHKPQIVKSADPEILSEITVGSYIRVKDKNITGKVLTLQGNKVEILFGEIKMRVERKNIEPLSGKEVKQIQKSQKGSVSNLFSDEMNQKRTNFKHQVDMRGMRVEEGINRLLLYLDDAVLVGANIVRILHGTGTGQLKQAIREHLKVSNVVKSFRDEQLDMGGAGITVVEME